MCSAWKGPWFKFWHDIFKSKLQQNFLRLSMNFYFMERSSFDILFHGEFWVTWGWWKDDERIFDLKQMRLGWTRPVCRGWFLPQNEVRVTFTASRWNYAGEILISICAIRSFVCERNSSPRRVCSCSSTNVMHFLKWSCNLIFKDTFLDV